MPLLASHKISIGAAIPTVFPTRVLWLQGHFERPPYSTSTMRSAYHVRELEAYRLKQLKQPVDVMLSHDWPDGIAYHGDLAQLLKCKPFLKTDVSLQSS